LSFSRERTFRAADAGTVRHAVECHLHAAPPCRAGADADAILQGKMDRKLNGSIASDI